MKRGITKHDILVTVLTVLMALTVFNYGCHATKPVTNGHPPAPVTWLEQANSDNAQISVHVRAGSKALVAAYQSGFVEKEYFDSASKLLITITRDHEAITPLLKDQATASTNVAKIRQWAGEIKSAAITIVQNGGAGIKNPISQTQIVNEINSIALLAQAIIDAFTSVKGATQ